MDKFNFSCTQCGKCCKKSPSVNFLEIFHLADKFVFQTAHRALLTTEKNPLEVEVIRHLEKVGHSIAMPELSAGMYYYINFETVEENTQHCSQLVNNKCSIYDQRPVSCQLQPLDPYLPESMQDRVFKLYQEVTTQKNETKRWECDLSDTQPIIWQNKSIQRVNDDELFYGYLKDTRLFTDSYVEFLSLAGTKHLNELFKNVYYASVQNNTMLSDMVISLQVALHNNFITHAQVHEFIEKQIALIDKRVHKSLIEKIKENRQATKLYKKQKEQYIKALDAGIFEESDEMQIPMVE